MKLLLMTAKSPHMAAAAAGDIETASSSLYVSYLKKLSSLPSCSESCLQARTIHAHIIISRFKPRSPILNGLINAYCKSSNLAYAHHLFDRIPHPNVVAATTMITAYSAAKDTKKAWEIFTNVPFRVRDTVFYNSMITCYSRNHEGHAALNLFRQMKIDAIPPDDFTYTSLLSALGLIADKETHCQQLHCQVVKSGTGLVTSVLNALVSVYLKCASSPFVSSSSLMSVAATLFHQMPVKDELSWTMMITGYVRNGNLKAAREMFDGMNEDKLPEAWNSMISGYVQNHMLAEALHLFGKMTSSGIRHDEFTYTSIISACANAKSFLLGKEVHARVLRNEHKPPKDFSLSVNNSLITFYSRCGRVEEAVRIFQSMSVKDIVSWNAVLTAYINDGRINQAKIFFSEIRDRNMLTWTTMISGLAQNGFGEEGLKLFNQMRHEGFQPCDYAFAGAITSCSVLAALEDGKQLHSQLIRFGFDSSLSAGNSLITMYARCGVVDAANRLFLTMPFLDDVSWNAMIAAFAHHGHGSRALNLFEEMLKEGISPDRISFLTVISACSHAGLVNEGRKYFNEMETVYGIKPGEDHYARLIDMLCRAGKFAEAEEVIENLNFKPGASIWEALLGGCRKHGNMNLGMKAAEKIFHLRPEHDGSYILLSNMYANVGRWDEMAKVRNLMRDRGIKKSPGCSWIEVENKFHVFLVDDTSHPQVEDVYRYLEELVGEMRKLGYVPDTKYVLHDMELEQKEQFLSTHSEKLAVTYGLLKLSAGATIRVFKNLRICGDCHNAFKFMSMVVNREIVVRDGKRFHHFSNGQCSCGDFW